MSTNLRNIPRVNYTGMDTIEPMDEYDSITNIWADETIYYDPDYNPQDDQDYDEDDEEHETTRNLRDIPPVDYSGMDMTEDDRGFVYVCKTTWKNRTPTYKMVEYPLSQVNEIGDEDYCDN